MTLGVAGKLLCVKKIQPLAVRNHGEGTSSSSKMSQATIFIKYPGIGIREGAAGAWPSWSVDVEDGLSFFRSGMSTLVIAYS